MAKRITAISWRSAITCYETHHWAGQLDEDEFLARLYNLSNMPSHDRRYSNAEQDIHMHRAFNRDESDDWIFTDARFGLATGPDEDRLRFFAETLHPEVRSSEDAQLLVRALNPILVRDGWELHIKGEVSGYPVYGFRACRPFILETPNDFPLDFLALLPTVAERLKYRGANAAIGALLHSNFTIRCGHYDNWDGGQQGWEILLKLPSTLLARTSPENEETITGPLVDSFNEALHGISGHSIDKIVLVPITSTQQTDWRSEANAYLRGDGISNQGRVRSNNIASYEHDGLLFRSKPEMNMYDAMKKHGIVFAPLPVFLQGGKSYSRVEPDFVILIAGRLVVVEVDGASFHTETPASAQRRLELFEKEGARVERFDASECDSFEGANDCVVRLIEKIRRLPR